MDPKVLVGPDLTEVRSALNARFVARFKHTDRAETRVLLETVDASPTNPYEVTVDQLILDPFAGQTQFDITERGTGDADSLETTLGTVTGFDGVSPAVSPAGNWSRLVKTITSDKIYTAIFVPGRAGDGFYSVSVRALPQNSGIDGQ